MAKASIRPSSAHRWLKCPAAPWLEGKYPSESSVYAERGTEAHEMVGVAMLYDLPLQTVMEKRYPKWGASLDEMESMAGYLEYCFSIGHEHSLTDVECKTEIIKHAGLTIKGTIDYLATTPFGDLEIVDYKHGQGVVVSAEGNPQIMLYALGGIRLGAIEPQKVLGHIYQPRADNISNFEMPAVELLQWRDETLKPAMERVAEAKDNPNANALPGEHCRWCAARLNCPAVTGGLQQALSIDLDNADPHQLRDIMIVSKSIEDRLSAVKAKVKGLLEAGVVMEGVELGSKAANLAWGDVKAAEAAFKDVPEAWNVSLKTPLQVKNILGDDAGSMGNLASRGEPHKFVRLSGADQVSVRQIDTPANALFAVQDEIK